MKREGRTTSKGSKKYSVASLVLFGVALLILASLLMYVVKSVRYKLEEHHVPLLTQEQKSNRTSADQEPECLLIWEEDDQGIQGYDLMTAVLEGMKVPYEHAIVEDVETIDIAAYPKIVLSVTDFELLGEFLSRLRTWVKDGGQLMVLYPPNGTGAFFTLNSIWGIHDYSSEMSVVQKIEFADDFMLGGNGRQFEISDPYDSALCVELDPESVVYSRSVDEYPVPLIWEKQSGKGKTVVCNLGFLEKAFRGIYTAAYSLLGDSFVYPVINGSTFYIDDFPSPVPEGNGVYISRDYGMSIQDFYTQVWWSDVCELARRYEIPYTGLVIEEYSDQVEGGFARNKYIDRYRYFGNMLLKDGGEIGLHGYNHMPLVLENFDYEGKYDSYVQWPSYAQMKNSIRELCLFCSDLYPGEALQVYVPPSNILSAEGLQMLTDDFENVKTVASLYLPGDLAFDQEFTVDENGMIYTPRIISGYVLDEYMQIAALSELNFHFVNTHFQHPDDVLDEDRGAPLGWEKLYDNLRNYMAWLYTSAPVIRNLTGSELAGAVERYDAIEVTRTSENGKLKLELTNFYDEAYLILRINTGQNFHMEGGSFEKLNDDLYLIRADRMDPVIIFD